MRAALDIRAALPELNARWGDWLEGNMDVHIGINTGPASVGNVGSEYKYKYGPLGNTVNLASGFSTTLPVLLAGDTMLMQQGTGTFGASVTGTSSNLTVGSGSIAFNAPVTLGTGNFTVQQGQATINTSLSAATITAPSRDVAISRRRRTRARKIHEDDDQQLSPT